MSAKIYAGVIASFSLLFAPASWAAIKEYHLNIDQGTVNITGKSVKRMTVNRKFIAPLLEFEEGDEATAVPQISQEEPQLRFFLFSPFFIRHKE
jgi:hypothetical protein